MVEASIIARRTDDSTNYAVYESAKPDVPEDDFVQALNGLYVNLAVFEQAGLEEPPEIVEINLGASEALTMQCDGDSGNMYQFSSAHELDGRDIVCSLYVAHRFFTDSEPESMGISLNMSATLSDWEEAEAEVEEDWGTVETDAPEDEIEGFVFGTSEGTPTEESDETSAEEQESDESEEADGVDGDTEELEQMVEAADSS